MDEVRNLKINHDKISKKQQKKKKKPIPNGFAIHGTNLLSDSEGRYFCYNCYLKHGEFSLLQYEEVPQLDEWIYQYRCHQCHYIVYLSNVII